MTWNTAPARKVTTIVRVNGVARPHEPSSVTWSQDITSDLPSSVTAGGQVSHRTGAVVWQSQGVTTRTPSPWYSGPAWVPTVGDSVTIDVTDGTNTYRVFTGLIDTVEGDATGARSSKLVAPLIGANRVVRFLAQTQTGGLVAEDTVGRFGTTPVWVVSEIARDLHYHSVPPAPEPAKLILDAPLQGSTYNYSASPYVNAQVVASHFAGFPNLQPLWSSGPDGFGLSSALVAWEPRTGGGTGAGSVGVSFQVYSPHSGPAKATLTHGTNETSVRVTGAGQIQVASVVSGVTTTVYPSDPLPVGTEGPHRVSVVFRGGKVHVRSTGREYTFDAPTPAGAVTRIKLDAENNACVAGLQVWHPTSLTDHHRPAWFPNAHYKYGTGTSPTLLTPSVRDERAGDVLESYADALLSPLWVDGQGHLQVVTGKALHDKGPALTVDALRDVSELSYSMALLDHRPTVEVTYEHAHQSNLTSTLQRTTVWQGSGGNIEQNTPEQTFVEVPDDEEWIGLSDPAAARRLTFDNRDAFNAGQGSWWGLSEDITAPEYLTITDVGSQITETLTPWAWKLTTSYPGADGAVQKAPTSAYIRGRYRETGLPIYRARALIKYEDRTVAVSTSGATVTDGTLSHDAGKWVTTTSAATQLAQWIHGMVSTPTPVLDGLRVRFDPRIDVGVKLAVNARSVFGADFQALVLSVDHDPGSDTTTVVARVTKVTTIALDTLEAVDNAHVGQTLAAWDQARAGRTLTSVAASPYL